MHFRRLNTNTASNLFAIYLVAMDNIHDDKAWR